MAIKFNASFANNRNNGLATAKTPSTAYDAGDFLVYTGIGGVIPYSASVTLFGTQTGTFVVGESVSQATSGATGIVLAAASTGIVVGTVTGTFDATHVVTGGTSSATMTPSSVLSDTKILGLSNSQITSASANYADSSDINVSTPVNIMDFLDIPVSVGTPTALMVGRYVNVDPANPGAVDVTTIGSTGQILITRVLSSAAAPAGMIKGVIANAVA